MSVYYDECKCKLKKEEYDLELIKKIVDITKYSFPFKESQIKAIIDVQNVCTKTR